MNKTPDEIKKGLECCSSEKMFCAPEDPKCSYDCGDETCIYNLMRDAITLIQQLEADNAQLNRCIENLTDKLNIAHDEVSKLQAERDAALKDINKNCYTCGVSAETLHEEPCNSCRRAGGNKENWQWRGGQKEE